MRQCKTYVAMLPTYCSLSCWYCACHWYTAFDSAAVFALEKEEYFVNETAGVVRIGVVKKAGSIDVGQSITVVVTPTQGTGSTDGAGVYEYNK